MHSQLFYLIGQLRAGGSERQLYYLLSSMKRERYKPVVAVWNSSEEDFYGPRIRELGVPIYTLGESSSRVAKLIALRRLVKTIQPGIIHSYSFYTNFAAYWAAWRTSSIPIGSVRSNFIRDKTESGPILGPLNGLCPRDQICNSFSAAETIRRSKGFFIPRRLSVVSNGIDLQNFGNLTMNHDAKTRILGIGTLSQVKRWDRLLVAAKELKGRGLDFLVQIVGDGPLRGELKQMTGDLAVTDCVEFLGQRSDISELLAKASFLVHTSDAEGCPNVVMEAMACARAIVAWGVGDIPFLIEDGKAGFVVSSKDIGILVERMATLITNRELCQKMGKEGRVRAERNFGLDRLEMQTLNAYCGAGWKEL